MSAEDKSPTSPTNSDESPKNTIRVIKTSDSDQTLVEVKVAGESGTKVTVFGGDGPKTENKTNEVVNGTEEIQPEKDTKAENESPEKESKSTESDTKSNKDVAAVNGVEKTVMKNEEKEKTEKDVDVERLKPLTKDEIDKIVSKYNKKKNLDKYLEFFWSVDEYGFGLFTVHQLYYRLWQMGRRITDREVASMFSDIDHDNDNLVSLDEFLDEMTREKPKPKTDEELRAIFQRIDKNQDGFLCLDDISAAFKEKDIQCLDTEIFWFLDKHTVRGDLKMDFQRFRKALRRY